MSKVTQLAGKGASPMSLEKNLNGYWKQTKGNISTWRDTYSGLTFLLGGKNLIFYFLDFLGFGTMTAYIILRKYHVYLEQ